MSISFYQTGMRIRVFPSCLGLVRSLNISFVILYTNLVTIFRLVNYIKILVLNDICISVKDGAY